MELPEVRLEKIHSRIEKLLSLQSELHHKITELESVNQVLTNKIRTLEADIFQVKKEEIALDNEKQNINLQKNQEINHKINELLSEIERCITLLKR